LRVDLLDPHLNLLDFTKPQLDGMTLAMFRCLRIPAEFDIPTAQMVRPCDERCDLYVTIDQVPVTAGPSWAKR